MYDNNYTIPSIESEKKDIVKGKEIWDTWIAKKNFSISDYIIVFLKEDFTLYEIAEPYFKFLKERKRINRIYLITDYFDIFKLDTFEIEDVLLLKDTYSMECFIKYVKTIRGDSNITFLTISDQHGCGIEELITSAKVSKEDYVKIALLDLGGLL